ncbi:MAG: hypothetical protein ABC596_05900 [Candidatus Methanosuratincola petrocarbonis]
MKIKVIERSFGPSSVLAECQCQHGNRFYVRVGIDRAVEDEVSEIYALDLRRERKLKKCGCARILGYGLEDFGVDLREFLDSREIGVGA